MSAIQKRRHQASELNARLGAVTAEVKTLRQMVRDRDNYIKGFAHDLDKVMELPHGRKEGQREEALRYEQRPCCGCAFHRNWMSLLRRVFWTFLARSVDHTSTVLARLAGGSALADSSTIAVDEMKYSTRPQSCGQVSHRRSPTDRSHVCAHTVSARRYLHRVYVNDSLDEAEKAEVLSTEEEARRQHSYLERKNAHLAKKKVVAERERAVEAVKGRVQNTVLLRDLADLHRQTTIDKQVCACLVCLRNASQ